MADYKVGDEVVYYPAGMNQKGQLVKIAKVTKSGQVTLENGKRFDVHGREYGTSDRWHRAFINESTVESRQRVANEQARDEQRKLALIAAFETWLKKASLGNLESLRRHLDLKVEGDKE